MSRNAPWGLRTQLIVWNIVALVLLQGLLGLVVRYTVGTVLTASVNRRLLAEVSSGPLPFFGHHGDRGPGGPPPDRPDMGPPDAPDFPHDRSSRKGEGSEGNLYSVRHFDLNGDPLGVRPMLDRQAFNIVKQGNVSTYYSRVTQDGMPLQVITVPYKEQGQILAVIQAGTPLTEIDQALAGVDRALLLLIPVGLLFAGAGGAYLTTRVLRRVRDTALAAERISVSREEGFSDRLPVVGRDEFSALAVTFNDLLGRLETTLQQQNRLLEQQRRFTADASHELKTPLTVIRGVAGMMLERETMASDADYKRAFQKIERSSETMSHLVHDLLLLARSDSGQLGRNSIELLVREILNQAVSGVAHRGAPIHIRMSNEALTVLGSETELVRVFSNLLDNAVRYTPSSGEIVVTAWQESDRVLIRVTDTGMGIAPEHLAHLGERFYRVDSSRTRADGGTGLGLSISKSIVEAHGGTMTIESTVGTGTTVTVALPIPHH